MTELRREAIRLLEQMPEEQISKVIRYMHTLKEQVLNADQIIDSNIAIKMRAFQELEEMLFPISAELDYDKELAEVREEKYCYFD